jgi:hypothetical protein
MEAEAIEQASQALAQWLTAARVVQVSIPVSGTGTGNPWLDTFGRSADDPDSRNTSRRSSRRAPRISANDSLPSRY